MEQMQTTTDWTKVAEVELVYRSNIKASDRPTISSSRDGFNLLLQHWNADTIELFEEFKVLLLNKSNKVLGIYSNSTGGICSTIADPRLILVTALKSLATGIILSHNHPSGNTQPSETDKKLTQKIKEAAALHDIQVLDHLIITTETYFSFNDEGLL